MQTVTNGELTSTLDLVESLIEKEYETCEKRVYDLRSIQSSLRSMCDHTLTQYVPDASGNNDSYYVCKICGLTKKRFK